jgi:hypothetical protein
VMRQEGGRGDDNTHPTKHPQALSQAMAHGVERGATSVYGMGGRQGTEGMRAGDGENMLPCALTTMTMWRATP